MNNINDTINCVNHDCDQCKAVQEPVAWMHTSGHIQGRNPNWEQVIADGYTRERGWTPLYTTPPAAQPAAHQCHWIQMDNEHMPDTWQGACGAVWTFTEGGPKDNDQTYCPKCGGVCIEVRAGEKGQP